MVPLVNPKDRAKGQGLVEYAFIFALVALVILAAMEFLAPSIKNMFIRISSPLNKNDGFQTSTPIQSPTPTQTPTPTPTPAWVTCAVENGFCSFSGPALVRYGANNTWASGTYTDGVLCANSIFGDPVYGTAKSCQILSSTPLPTATPVPTLTTTPMASWTTCAVENTVCSFSGPALVRYGANGSWVSGTYTDGVLCANSVFGDPIAGTVKSCQIYR